MFPGGLYSDLPPSSESAGDPAAPVTVPVAAAPAPTGPKGRWSLPPVESSNQKASFLMPISLKKRKKRAPAAFSTKPRKAPTPAVSHSISPSDATRPVSVKDIHDVPVPMTAATNPSTGRAVVAPEAIGALHASAAHLDLPAEELYRPSAPNDYLAFKQSVIDEERAVEMRRANELAMREAEEVRERIAEERRRIAADIMDGGAGVAGGVDTEGVGGGLGGGSAAVASSLQSGQGARGRGRGRGMSNMPAWLLKKQEEGGGGGDGNGSGLPPRPPPRSVVVLSNMVGPDEVDDELSAEVREECEEKCGPVRDVAVHVSHGVVNVQVEFGNGSDARAALKVFDGRMFGGRRIRANMLVGSGG